MLFEWDEEKNYLNLKKHRVDFETAALVFGDDERLVLYDEKHSYDEDRYITIGSVKECVIVLFVVYTEKEDVIRLISARKANNAERRKYYAEKEY